jgi:ferrous iron transport protein B
VNCSPASSPAPSNTAPVILVGNPNVGKSVIFGWLTGRYVTVSNYPGTTVEIAQGTMPNGTPVIDTPGTNTLTSHSDDERVTADVLLNHRGNVRAVIQVADAKNLQRALLLTVQLAELGLPLVLNLNMLDEAEINGVQIEVEKLSSRLGIEVIPTVATKGTGMERLLAAIERARPAAFAPRYDPPLETVIERVSTWLPPDTAYPRGLALRLLSGDTDRATGFGLNGSLTQITDETSAVYGCPLRTVIVGQQIQAAQALTEDIVTFRQHHRTLSQERLSRWMIHPFWGWPILLMVLWVVYKFVGEFGAGTLVDFMEGTVFNEWINPAATQIVDQFLPLSLIHDLLVGQYGVITMALSYGLALVLPIVATFFLAFSILEDSGYLPRLAIMLNRVFKLMGLNGKAVLPMVLGLGCDTMATMSTRILETRKERILVTLLLALGVPCSAQLGVIMGMLGQVSAVGVVIWAAVILVTMLTVGLLAAWLLPGERSDFILELPPLRLPRLDNIVIKTLARIEWYLKEVLPLFIVGTLLLFALDTTGVLATIEQIASPLVVGTLGLPPAATGAFLIGFLRRDYGAAGLFTLALSGQLDALQIVVSLIVITLFIPCIANLMMIVKEYGGRVAAGVALTIFPLAFAVGGLVNLALHTLKIAP